MMPVTVIGGCHMDRHLHFHAAPIAGRTNPVRIVETAGGVAANIARHMAAAGHQVGFASVHPDGDAAPLSAHLQAAGITSRLAPLAGEAPSYTALIGPDGELVIGAAALSIYDKVTSDLLADLLADMLQQSAPQPAQGGKPQAIIMDANFPAAVLLAVVDRSAPKTRLCAAATSLRKVDRLAGILPRLDALVLNRAEAVRLAETLSGGNPSSEVAALAGMLAGQMQTKGHVLVSDGGDLAALATAGRVVTAMPPAIRVANANGAGDAMAAMLFSSLLRHHPVGKDSDAAAILAAALTAGARFAAQSTEGLS